jgi:hypothetical protein
MIPRAQPQAETFDELRAQAQTRWPDLTGDDFLGDAATAAGLLHMLAQRYALTEDGVRDSLSAGAVVTTDLAAWEALIHRARGSWPKLSDEDFLSVGRSVFELARLIRRQYGGSPDMIAGRLGVPPEPPSHRHAVHHGGKRPLTGRSQPVRDPTDVD